jgi:integrase
VGRPSTTGGVSARGNNGIQYDFMLEGVRYRPTDKQIPTEANLRRAREHVKAIKERIRLGTFSFAKEFPDFRDLHKLINRSPWRTCNQVFDEYLQQCEARLAKHDFSLAAVVGYRKVLDSIWRPSLRALPFLQVRYSMLVKIADSHKAWSKKTYNNAVRVLRRAFAFGYREGKRTSKLRETLSEALLCLWSSARGTIFKRFAVYAVEQRPINWRVPQRHP